MRRETRKEKREKTKEICFLPMIENGMKYDTLLFIISGTARYQNTAYLAVVTYEYSVVTVSLYPEM